MDDASLPLPAIPTLTNATALAQLIRTFAETLKSERDPELVRIYARALITSASPEHQPGAVRPVTTQL